MRLMVLALLASAAPAFGAIVNGNFEAGNTGFQSDYDFRTVSNSPYAGQYGVTTSSFAWSQFWNNVPGDHTTGTGQFLIVDVAGSANTNDMWRQTVSVSPNTSYNLQAWLATWTSYPAATINVLVDGVAVGSMAAPSGATWMQRTVSFTTGSVSSIVLALRPATFFQPGDDVAVDDMTLTAVPAPAATLVLAGGSLLLTRRRRA